MYEHAHTLSLSIYSYINARKPRQIDREGKVNGREGRSGQRTRIRQSMRRVTGIREWEEENH